MRKNASELISTDGRFALDTNIIVARFASDENVLARSREANAIFVPSIVIGELYFGVQKSGRIESNGQRVDDLAATTAILDCDAETARFYAIVKNQLRLKGKPIPENDMWIAATALRYDLTLVTRDAHFGNVETLRVERW